MSGSVLQQSAVNDMGGAPSARTAFPFSLFHLLKSFFIPLEIGCGRVGPVCYNELTESRASQSAKLTESGIVARKGGDFVLYDAHITPHYMKTAFIWCGVIPLNDFIASIAS